MYFLIKGEIPKDYYICHHCDNPKCYLIDHLFLGSSKDNAQDRLEKGREGNRKNVKNGRSKLNDDDISTIRSMYSIGITGTKIAKKFNVTHVLIYKIINKKLWDHI